MTDPRPAELLGAMQRQLGALERIFEAIGRAVDQDATALGRSDNAAVMVAGLLDNYYTCLETLFLRISQFFENSLDAERWHTDLLEKMTLEEEGVRGRVISDESFRSLLELLKFRHFRRYYFELQYDWDRLDFLVMKLRDVHPRVRTDLARFVEFVKSI